MQCCCRHPFLILVNFIATLVTAISLGLVFRNVGVDTPGIQNRSGWAAAAQLHECLCHSHMWYFVHSTQLHSGLSNSAQLHVDLCHARTCLWASVTATALLVSSSCVTCD